MDYAGFLGSTLKATHAADVRIGEMVAYIKRHGIDAFAANGKIKAREVYTIDTVPGEQWVELEPTWGAVRAWLGY